MVEFGQRRRLTTEADPQMRSVECGRKGAGVFFVWVLKEEERGGERERERKSAQESHEAERALLTYTQLEENLREQTKTER